MIDYKEKDYRLTNIMNLFTGIVDEKEGLAIEKKMSVGEEYSVIMFIKPDEHGILEIKAVGMKLLDIDDEDWKLVKKLIDIARGIIRD